MRSSKWLSLRRFKRTAVASAHDGACVSVAPTAGGTKITLRRNRNWPHITIPYDYPRRERVMFPTLAEAVEVFLNLFFSRAPRCWCHVDTGARYHCRAGKVSCGGYERVSRATASGRRCEGHMSAQSPGGMRRARREFPASRRTRAAVVRNRYYLIKDVCIRRDSSSRALFPALSSR